MATKLIPSRATAEPPSGTPTEAVFAEKLKKSPVPPPAFWTVNAHLAVVASNPLPLTVPTPVMLRNVADCITTVALVRSNVNPPTLHRPGVAVEGVNIHGTAIVAWVPSGTTTKSPVVAATFDKFGPFPNTSRHSRTLVTFWRADESKRTE